jgi:sugar lactone lactonase YvrE
VDDLIRETIHDALAVEQPPAGLRARVIGAVPMNKRETQSRGRPSFQWAAGLVALGVTVAVIAGLVYNHGVLTSPSGKAPAASSARLISPEGLGVAPDGSLYVSDYLGNRVYRVQPDGSLVLIAGGGTQYEGPATKSNIFGPSGLAFDQDGNLYIADNRGGVIRRVDRNGMLTSFATMHVSSSLNNPLGLAFDRSGVLFVGAYNGDLVAIQPNGSTSTIDLSAVGPPAVIAGYLAFDSVGNLYVADRSAQANTTAVGGGCRIIRVKPDRSVQVFAGTGKCGFSGDGGPAAGAEIDDPNGIAFDAAGNLYFADSNNHRIRRIDPQGIITTVAGTGVEGHTGDGGPAVKAQLGYLAGIALRGKFLYISDNCGCMDSAQYGAVRMLHLSDGTITTVASSRSRVVG